MQHGLAPAAAAQKTAVRHQAAARKRQRDSQRHRNAECRTLRCAGAVHVTMLERRRRKRQQQSSACEHTVAAPKQRRALARCATSAQQPVCSGSKQRHAQQRRSRPAQQQAPQRSQTLHACGHARACSGAQRAAARRAPVRGSPQLHQLVRGAQ
jgi:CDGSH-type Zn-finger protein